jgi:ketosteroid isomerase-like protein
MTAGRARAWLDGLLAERLLTAKSNDDRLMRRTDARAGPTGQTERNGDGRDQEAQMSGDELAANKAIARRVLELISRYQFEQALQLLAPDAVWSEFGRVHHQKDKLLPDLEFLKGRFDASGISMTVRDVIAEGNRVALTADEKATTVEGKAYSNAFTFWFTVVDGMVTAVDQYHDTHMVLTTIRAGEGWRDYSGQPEDAER